MTQYTTTPAPVKAVLATNTFHPATAMTTSTRNADGTAHMAATPRGGSHGHAVGPRQVVRAPGAEPDQGRELEEHPEAAVQGKLVTATTMVSKLRNDMPRARWRP